MKTWKIKFIPSGSYLDVIAMRQEGVVAIVVKSEELAHVFADYEMVQNVKFDLENLGYSCELKGYP